MEGLPSPPPICATIQEASAEAALARARAVADSCALLELRLDAAPPGALDLGALAAAPRPWLLTCRPVREGGAWAGPEPARLAALAEAARVLGAAWVDVEHDAVDALPPLPPAARLLVSCHRFAPGGDPSELLARVRHPRAAAGKVALAVASAEEALRLLRLAAAEPRPTVAVAMGAAGLVSRVAATRWGAPFVYAAADPARPAAPGQLPAEVVARLLGGRRPGPEAALYGVLGRPVGHSRSPHLMNAAFARLGHDGVYTWFESSDPAAFLAEAERDPGLRGLSVTIPHKQACVALLRARGAALPEEVAATGALNTLARRPDGTWRAANTDALAARTLVGRTLGEGGRGARVLVLGSGGAARAVAWAARAEGADVRVHARSAARGRALARELEVAWGGDLTALPRADGPDAARLVINATSVGMTGGPAPDASPAPAHALGPGVAAYDLVYTPEETPFLRAARARGAAAIGGLEHFVLQARAQLALWLGPQVDDLPLDWLARSARA